MRPKFNNTGNSMREVIVSFFLDLTKKNTFFEGCSWFKFNNLGLALGIALEFYTGLATLFLKNRYAQRPTISPKPYWVFPQISLEQ